MLMVSCPPSILQFSQTEATSMKHQHQTLISTCVTSSMRMFRTSTRILLIWLPHVSVIHDALLHTASAHVMDGRSAVLATPLQPQTDIVMEEEPTVLTARNDGMVNSFNPVQLSAWRANVDMQYIVSHRRVIEYCTKYVTKSEPQSQSLKEVYTSIVRSLQEGNTSLKVVQKLLINTAGARDYCPGIMPPSTASNVQRIKGFHCPQPRWLSCSSRSLGRGSACYCTVNC